MSIDRTRPGDFDEDPTSGWDSVGDEDAVARDAEDAEARTLLTDAALRPDDPVAGEAVRRGADPDLAVDDDRGEEP